MILFRERILLRMNWDEIDPEDTNVIMHVYRGELQRINNWRQRMDRTTNWAIVVTSGIITFSLSNPNIPHWTVLPGLFLAYILLFTEARRYRHYDQWRGRVRALEELFLAKFFDRDMEINEKWVKILSDDFKNPKFKMSWEEAVKRRLKRIYVWIIAVFTSVWIAKIYMHPERATSFRIFFDRIAGPLGISVGLIVFGIIVGLIAFSISYYFLAAPSREATGRAEEMEIDEKFATEEYIEKFEEEKD